MPLQIRDVMVSSAKKGPLSEQVTHLPWLSGLGPANQKWTCTTQDVPETGF